MKKKLTVILAVTMVIVMSLTGCTQGNQSAESGSKKKRQLVVYSPNNPEINNPIIKEFQDRTGIEVQLITAGTGELMKRVEAEAANPMGDVFFGGGQESHDAISKYFFPYVTEEVEHLNEKYLDPNEIWTPQSILPMVIMYNKDLVKPGEEPQGWEDLLDSKWKGKIAYSDPARSASSYTQLVTILSVFGRDDEHGWNFVKQLLENMEYKILSGSAMVYQGVADKEFQVGITLEEAALRYIENGANVGIIYPKEGTSARSDGNSIIKGAKNLEQAKLFIDFISGKDVHDLMQKEFLRRSVRTDAAKIEGVVETKDLKVISYDTNWASENKDEVLIRFNKIITGQER